MVLLVLSMLIKLNCQCTNTSELVPRNVQIILHRRNLFPLRIVCSADFLAANGQSEAIGVSLEDCKFYSACLFVFIGG